MHRDLASLMSTSIIIAYSFVVLTVAGVKVINKSNSIFQDDALAAGRDDIT